MKQWKMEDEKLKEQENVLETIVYMITLYESCNNLSPSLGIYPLFVSSYNLFVSKSY